MSTTNPFKLHVKLLFAEVIRYSIYARLCNRIRRDVYGMLRARASQSIYLRGFVGCAICRPIYKPHTYAISHLDIFHVRKT